MLFDNITLMLFNNTVRTSYLEFRSPGPNNQSLGLLIYSLTYSQVYTSYPSQNIQVSIYPVACIPNISVDVTTTSMATHLYGQTHLPHGHARTATYRHHKFMQHSFYNPHAYQLLATSHTQDSTIASEVFYILSQPHPSHRLCKFTPLTVPTALLSELVYQK